MNRYFPDRPWIYLHLSALASVLTVITLIMWQHKPQKCFYLIFCEIEPTKIRYKQTKIKNISGWDQLGTGVMYDVMYEWWWGTFIARIDRQRLTFADISPTWKKHEMDWNGHSAHNSQLGTKELSTLPEFSDIKTPDITTLSAHNQW